MNRLIVYAKHPLVAGSGVIFIGSFLANLINFVFNLFMGRWLSVEDYGLLISLLSFTVLFGILQSSMSTLFAKFSSKYSVTGKNNYLAVLFFNGTKGLLLFSMITVVILLFFSSYVTEYLKVQNNLLILLIYATILFSLLYSLPIGFLQGQMKFLKLSIINVSVPLVKLILGFAALILGMQLVGVLFGVLFSILIPFIYIFSYYYLQFRKTKSHANGISKDIQKEFFQYSIPFILAWFGITMISNADIIMVRHFFNPVVSGQYAALSLMGKAIFYFTTPIYMVFFPLIVQKRELKQSVAETAIIASFIVGGFSVALSFWYFLFPNVVLRIFFPGPDYVSLAPFLGPFSLYIIVYSLAFLLCNFLLSSGKTGIYPINLFCGVLMVVLFTFFHSSLYQIIGILFFVSLLLLLMLSIYYFRSRK